MRLSADQRATILAFMKSHPMAVITTYDAERTQPEAALIAFAETDELEIVFETFDIARKYRNLHAHPKVALVIGWDLEKHVTLQIEGEAREVNSNETEECRALMLAKKTPCTEEFLSDSRVKFFKVTPHWIRFSNYSKDPPEIVEGEI